LRGGRGTKGAAAFPAWAWAAAAAVLCTLVFATAPASAQLLPQGFFDQGPRMGEKAQVEADMLAYDARTSTISAEGGVVLRYDGYTLRADRVSFNQSSGEVFAEGNVLVVDPDGNEYEADRIEVTDGLKAAFVDSLTLTTAEGALIEARDVRWASELEAVITDASYSPCGLCIDSKGRKIGWKVRASKIVYDRERALVFLEGAGLEVLGVPVAWIPWLVLPDPSQPRAQGFRLPSLGYKTEYGGRLNVPYFVPISEDIDLLLTPTLLTRQGFLMAAQWTHRLPWGSYDIKASGLYQLDPMAWSFPGSQKQWRGAIQTTGEFTPLEDWTVGWSYTAFTDPAYLEDYDFTSADQVNQVYATYLDRDTYFDIRAKQFLYVGDVTTVQQERQALTIPDIEVAHYVNFDDWGQIRLKADLEGIHRDGDAGPVVYNGIPYIFGYEQNKFHATLEGSWQKQVVLPGGVLATPYLGARLDAGYFERSGPPLAPPPPTPDSGISLLEATPIAAIDFRWPLVADSDFGSHIFEPVAQLVYRGSSTTLTGITNDNAQSFVFDDTLLFDYNRFSGTDRQETGLRANIGGRYLANFDDDAWLQLIGGQSYHLAGTNALGIIDHAQTGNSSGLEGTASYLVLGAKGSPGYGIDVGAKTQIDSSTFRVMRAAVASGVSWRSYRVGAAYAYIPANPAVGTIVDQHEATLSASGPLFLDYWYADASLSWDIAANTWLEAAGGITYDDGYFVAGLFGKINGPTHENPNGSSFGLKFRLRGPDGEWGY
jgi:LPS-assembly protein